MPDPYAPSLPLTHEGLHEHDLVAFALGSNGIVSNGSRDDEGLRIVHDKWRNHVEKCGLRTFRNRSLLHGLKGQRERLAGKLSVQGLIGEFGEDKAFSHLYVLEKNEIDADELRAYLARLMVSAKGNHDAMVKLLRSKPEIRRAVRIYDYIRYFRQHVE